MKTAGGFEVPEHCKAGCRVLVFSPLKQVWQPATVLTVGEHISVVKIDNGPQVVRRWEEIRPA